MICLVMTVTTMAFLPFLESNKKVENNCVGVKRGSSG
jgi:hypothetical protein